MINNDLAERYTDKINSLAKTSSKISTDNTAKIKSISSEIETLETKRKEIGEGIKIEKNNKFYEYIMQTSPKEVATLAIDFESQGFSFLTDLLKDPKLKFQVPVEALKKISEIDKEIDRRKQSKLTFIEQVKDTVSLVKKDRRKHFKEAMVHLVNTTSKDPNKRERDIRNIEEKMDAPKSIKAAVKEKFSARQR